MTVFAKVTSKLLLLAKFNTKLADPYPSPPTLATVGQSGTIVVRQDGTGSRLLTFNYQWHFAGGTDATLTTTASAVDRLDYYVLAANAIHVVATLDLK